MRYVFWLLLLINLGFFGWHFLQPENTASPLPAADPGVEKLVLVTEAESARKAAGAAAARQAMKPPVETETKASAEPESKPETPKEPEQPSVAATETEAQPEPEPREPAVCYALGLFDTPEEAETAQARLSKQGIQATRMEDYRGRMIYYVYLPPYPSLQQAQKVANELAKKGIRDYQVLVSPAKKNAISLGVYSIKDTADIRMDQIQKLGYAPKMDEEPRGKPKYRLEWGVTDPQGMKLQDKTAILKGYPGKSLTQVVCQ